jgi:hypothetical protein
MSPQTQPSLKLSGVMLLLILILFQFCKPSQTAKSDASKEPVVVSVFYEKDIRPIMLGSCTPCHFPEQGKKKMLDSYTATKENINDIIARIQLPVEDEKFMPFRSKKAPLTADQIKVFKEWVKQGMAN